MDETADVTGLLERLTAGEAGAQHALMPLVYGELRTIAARLLRAERTGHTLQPTALVHEAYLRLVDQRRADYRSRRHFLAIAAMAMRRILVNHAKARAAAKRGGKARRVPLTIQTPAGQRGPDVIALDEALDRLERRHARKAAVVEQRFFAGLDLSQIAENLGVSLATVKRDWEYARTWLAREVQDEA